MVVVESVLDSYVQVEIGVVVVRVVAACRKREKDVRLGVFLFRLDDHRDANDDKEEEVELATCEEEASSSSSFREEEASSSSSFREEVAWEIQPVVQRVVVLPVLFLLESHRQCLAREDHHLHWKKKDSVVPYLKFDLFYNRLYEAMMEL